MQTGKLSFTPKRKEGGKNQEFYLKIVIKKQALKSATTNEYFSLTLFSISLIC